MAPYSPLEKGFRLTKHNRHYYYYFEAPYSPLEKGFRPIKQFF